MAIVATWWPGRYYKVSTVQLDSSSPIAQLAQSMEQKVPFEKVVPGPDKYITQVFRCTADGIVRSFFEPLFERQYSCISSARAGHKETVDLLERGRLQLGRTVEIEDRE
jgi:hypothetical protein